MEGENINIIDNIIQAVSILNKTDEYLESLTNRLSECDSLVSDYEHFIENTPIDDNREFLIQTLKKTQSKLGTKYHNRILSNEDIAELKKIEEKKKRGRPRKKVQNEE